MRASLSKTIVSPERFIPGKMKPHGCVFCHVPVLDLSYGESGNNIEKQEGAFIRSLLLFVSLLDFIPRLKPVFIRQTHCVLDRNLCGQAAFLKLEEVDLCYLRRFLTPDWGEERPAVAFSCGENSVIKMEPKLFLPLGCRWTPTYLLSQFKV